MKEKLAKISRLKEKIQARKMTADFADFIREQGVVGLAVGFILGAAVTKLVAALVTDIINPVLSIFLGAASSFKEAYVTVGTIKILWGDFLSTFIDFIVIALTVYVLVKIFKLDKLDKKKN